jgi:hypothetical protein
MVNKEEEKKERETKRRLQKKRPKKVVEGGETALTPPSTSQHTLRCRVQTQED